MKSRTTRGIYLKLGLLLSLIVLFFVTRAVWIAFGQKLQSEKYLAQVSAEKEDLLSRQQKLESLIVNLRDKDGLEEEVRKKFSVAKEGENVVIIVDEEATNTAPKPKSSNFFKDLFGWFF